MTMSVYTFQVTRCNLRLLVGRVLFFLASILVLIIVVVGHVNFDTKLVTQLVDANTLCTNNTRDVLSIDVKFNRLNKLG